MLRIRPALGRPFTADNEVDGNQRVAVLSEAFWKRRFGGNPDVVGRIILLDDARFEVVGIMPPGVTYPVGAARPTDLWIPYVVPESQRSRGARTVGAYLQVIARLEPDVSLERAQAQMDQVAAAIEQANPQWVKDNKIGVRPLRDHLVGASMKSWMLMLLGAVAIVLLIACANVANLLLARASTREREVAVRAALGAGRWRLIRQLMIESLVLSVVGTAMAVMLASWTVQVLRSAMPEGVPRVATIALDLRVLAAAACLSLVTGVLCGIVPALQLSRPNLTNSLKDGIHGASAGRGRRRLRGMLVVAEVALAVVLLVGAGLFIGSFMALMRIDPGFNPDRVLTVDIISRVEPGQRPPDRSAVFGEIAERLGKVPGVVHASMSRGGVPFGMRLVDQQPQGSRQDDRERPWRQHQSRDAGLPQSDGDPPATRPAVRRDGLRGRPERGDHQRLCGEDVFSRRGPRGTHGQPERRRSHRRRRRRRRATAEPRGRHAPRGLSADVPNREQLRRGGGSHERRRRTTSCPR